MMNIILFRAEYRLASSLLHVSFPVHSNGCVSVCVFWQSLQVSTYFKFILLYLFYVLIIIVSFLSTPSSIIIICRSYSYMSLSIRTCSSSSVLLLNFIILTNLDLFENNNPAYYLHQQHHRTKITHYYKWRRSVHNSDEYIFYKESNDTCQSGKLLSLLLEICQMNLDILSLQTTINDS